MVYDGECSKKKGKSYINDPLDRVSLVSLLLRVDREDEVDYHMCNTQSRWDGSNNPLHELATINILEHNKMES
eukprot:12886647-Prorocentrum_lima.AAC.1